MALSNFQLPPDITAAYSPILVTCDTDTDTNFNYGAVIDCSNTLNNNSFMQILTSVPHLLQVGDYISFLIDTSFNSVEIVNYYSNKHFKVIKVINSTNIVIETQFELIVGSQIRRFKKNYYTLINFYIKTEGNIENLVLKKVIQPYKSGGILRFRIDFSPTVILFSKVLNKVLNLNIPVFVGRNADNFNSQVEWGFEFIEVWDRGNGTGTIGEQESPTLITI